VSPGRMLRRSAPFAAWSGLGLTIAWTLAVAALFSPLRRRVRTVVDRRFNRARYDARRTMEAFAHQLREDVDLAALDRDLRAVVTTSLQPVNMTLWLRGAGKVRT
jgi:hypothetical protein